MVYIIGILGFIGGFIIGQYILLQMLKNRSREELLNDTSLRYTYGILNWIVAGIGSYLCVTAYKMFFMS